MSGSTYYIRESGSWLSGNDYVVEVAPDRRVFLQYRTGERTRADGYLAADAEGYARAGVWTKLDAPCHADVLLELANSPEPQP